jgi:hypothetical protein
MANQQTHWVMDYETICNCFVAVFTHYKEDTRRVFVVHENRNDFPQYVQFLKDCVSNKEWHISYNGLAFDAQITQWVLQNQQKLLPLSSPNLVKEIYQFAQDVISRTDRGEFSLYAPYQLQIKQIDLFKMNHWDNRAKMSSLKWIQYSMDWENIEEMPHPHNQPVLSQDTLEKVITYCINDVESTKEILNFSKDQIKLRQTLTKEYGIDLYSASEPRISKELFLHFLSEKLGWNKIEIKQLRTTRSYIILAECILPYVKFKTPEFNNVLDFFRTKVITSTKDGFKHSVTYRGVQTDYGLGGIHGAISSGIYEAKPGWTIMTSDVISFYPNLAIRNGFAPEHLPKKEFGELYEWFFDERKKIPKSDPKNYVFKIILNSTYGLTGDENSFLYDPKMTMQITVNGQLLLSMLYEMIYEEIPEAIPLMQNTDGLETMIPTAYVQKYMDICARWEQLTNLSLEHDQYTKMVIRDVNNYIAVTAEKKAKDDPKEGLTAEQVWNKMKKSSPSYKFRTDGTDFFYTAVKCKGAFEWEDLHKKKVAVFHKNKSFLIIPKAIHAYFVYGTKPEEFLAQNTNILDYCAGVKSKGGWYFETRQLVDDVPEKYKNMSIEEKRQYLLANGWEQSWSDDNWVRHDAVSKEANTGLDTERAFNITVKKLSVVQKTKLQKIIRYFVSNQGNKIIKCHSDGREIQVESGPWLQTVINRIDKNKPFQDYDLNLKYYLEEIYKQIDQMEKIKPKSFTQLSLF